jgi:hypothetical protein
MTYRSHVICPVGASGHLETMPGNQTTVLLYEHKPNGGLGEGIISPVLKYVPRHEGVWGVEVKLHIVYLSLANWINVK